MSKKQMIYKFLQLINDCKNTETQNRLLDGLKKISKEVLTVENYEKMFDVKLQEH